MNTPNNNTELSNPLDFKGPSHLYLPRTGDKERVEAFYKDFLAASLEQLVERYNHNQKSGMFGVHAQGLAMIALNLAFLKRYQRSPLIIIDKCIISFGKPIRAVHDTWEYLE